MRQGLLALAGLGAGAMAGLELLNRRVAIARDQLEPQLPAPHRMWRWRFGEVAVYEAGDPHNPPVLLLHGHNAAASAAEMCEPFMRLAEQYHVYAPDLLGYGLSDRPDVDYSPQLYIELIEDILREVVEKPAAIIGSSLTSAHAIEATANNPEWVTTLVLSCPTGVRHLTGQPSGGGIVERLLRVPIVGQAAYNGIASRRSIRYFLESQTYHDPTRVTEEMVERNYRVAHGPGARYAPSAFVAGKLYWDAGEAWTRIVPNCLLVWGREAKITPLTDSVAFLALNPGAQLEAISGAGILPHDEQPEQFERIVRAWLEREIER